MGMNLGLPRLPKLGKQGLFSIILVIGIVQASAVDMYFEAKKSEITILDVAGAPEVISSSPTPT